MKRLRLAILLLLIPLCCVAFAALTKTTSIVEVDAWQSISAATLVVGNAGDISDSYTTIIYLEIPFTSGNANDGVGVSIEVSYSDDNWTLLTPMFTTPDAASGPSDTIDGAVSAGGTTLDLADGTAFVTPGQKFFIDDGGNSESVRIKSVTAGEITLCHDFLFSHAHLTPVWPIVYERVIPIPAAFAYVRVIINNTDANADIHYTTRISKVTSLN